MQSKLTISIDKNLIEEAKKYAKQHSRSLSALIENYLKLMVRDRIKDKMDVSKEISEIRKLRGSLKLPKDFDYKTELAKTLEKKYSR